ncbi:MAG: hypothetical protein KDD55_12405 [Bdellovibrionales bacterium]|nr:hypothetical protein [Bdellovibrionales bacterium]
MSEGVAGVAKKKSSRSLPHLLAILLLLLLILVSALFWLEIHRRFPRLPEGDYVGSLSGVLGSERKERVHFFARSSSEHIEFVLLRSGWKPYRLSTRLDSSSEDTLYPLQLEGPDGSLFFVGEQVEPHSYKGFVSDLQSNEEGTWELKQVSAAEIQALSSESDLLHWIRMFDELQRIEGSRVAAETRLPQLKREVVRLESFITEGEKLKEQGGDSFQNAQAEIVHLEEELKNEKNNARVLLEKLQVAQRVTPMGTLVSLAREAAERDARWISSMMRSDGAATGSRGFEADYERAQEVLELLEGIRRENKLIEALSQGKRMKRVPFGSSQPTQEEEGV